MIVSQTVDAASLETLLTEMRAEFCAHSWKKFPVDIAPQDLLARENERRPTTIHYYHQRADVDGPPILVAAASVADAIAHDAPVSGFPVLARCYVRPAFRGTGLYRRILRHRLLSLIDQGGANLKAVHMGTADERVARTIADRSLPWNGFVRIGGEDLSIGAKTVRVGGYLLFSPSYAEALLQEAADLRVPAGGLSAGEVFERLLAGGWREPEDAYSRLLDVLAANPSARDLDAASPIRQLTAFCASVPFVYAPAAEGRPPSAARRKTPEPENAG